MKIDKLLKGYARHRRESAGSKFELHAAKRHALQGEVARTYRNQGDRTPSKLLWISRFWLRFGLGAGVVACFALVFVSIYPVLFPKSVPKGVSLAKQEKSTLPELGKLAETRREQPRRSRAPDAASVTEPLSDNAADVSREATVKLNENEVLAKSEPVAVEEAHETGPLRPEAKAADEPTLLTDRSNRRLSATPTVRRITRGVGSGIGMLAIEPEQSNAVIAVAGRAMAGVESVSPGTNVIVAQQTVDNMQSAAAMPKPAGSPGVLATAVTNDKMSLDKSKSEEKRQFYGGNATDLSSNFDDGLADKKTTEMLGMRVAESRDTESTNSIAFNFSIQAVSAQNQLGLAQNKDNLDLGLNRQKSQVVSSPVLNSFQFRQQGDKVTIIDADGSVYKGQIVSQEVAAVASPSNRDAARGGAQPISTLPRLANQAQPVPGSRFSNPANSQAIAGRFQNRMGQQSLNAVSFQAAGSNGTLMQNVAIQGQIVGLNNTLATNSLYLNNQSTPPSGASAKTFFGLSNNATEPIRIQGQVIIGATNRLEIDAVQQTP